MLNYLWAAMILIGVMAGALTGRMPDVTNACLESSADAVSVCIRMAGVVAMWSGLMKIAERSGLITILSQKIYPVLAFLFPTIDKNSKAIKYISINFIANILGLGWAATPAGLNAMDELQKLNPDKTKASVEMCTFMIINMSSLQLITVNILSYRAQYGSTSPTEIIGPGLFATLISSLAAVIFAKVASIFYTGKSTAVSTHRRFRHKSGGTA